jgi:hypothetical protein
MKISNEKKQLSAANKMLKDKFSNILPEEGRTFKQIINNLEVWSKSRGILYF